MAELGSISAVVVAVLTAGGLITWVVKSSVSSMVKQSRMFMESALENMRANTAAIKAQSETLASLRQRIDMETRIRDERDRAMFKQLDRVEEKVGRR